MARWIFPFLILAAACGPSQDPLADALDTWAEEGAADYALTTRLDCACEEGGTYEAEVEDGVASRVTWIAGGESVELDAADAPVWGTVDGLFSLASFVLLNADRASVRYADEGYPTDIDVDMRGTETGDEARYSVLEYVPDGA